MNVETTLEKLKQRYPNEPEYFQAVWVKNEWSRFLKLMAKDKEKHFL